MNETTVIHDIIRERIVNTCHQAWKDYMDIIEHAYIQIEPTEDLAQSILSGAYVVVTNPDITPDQIHQEWMDYRAKEGWEYGDVKDPELKTHPNMLPFYELPIEERIKDMVFINAVHMAVCQLHLAGISDDLIEEALI